ncbi:TolC family protein, partial [Wenyingzhuangia sp. 1_MG-2023]|nr:TolC family protein [Wenyingzhuangia sp. 1_MG-2023]
SYSYTHYDVEAESASIISIINNNDYSVSTSTADYELGALQLSASQTLFNLNSWYTYQAAKTIDSSYESQLQLAEQQLLLRTAQAYFNILRAADN